MHFIIKLFYAHLEIRNGKVLNYSEKIPKGFINDVAVDLGVEKVSFELPCGQQN